MISSLVTRDFEHIVRTCDLDNWREALAVSLTYAKADEFSNLCGEWTVQCCGTADELCNGPLACK